MLKYAILGFLNYGPQSGYDIKQLIDNSTSNFWHAKQSQVYTVLKTLEQNSMVESTAEMHGEYIKKRTYEITDEGKIHLKNWLEQPLLDIDEYKSSFLLKLFFARQIDTETILMELQLQQKLHQQQLKKHQTNTREVIEEYASLSPELKMESRYWEYTRIFGEMLEEVYLRWIDYVYQDINKK